jgi:hypothetical protein
MEHKTWPAVTKPDLNRPPRCDRSKPIRAAMIVLTARRP